MINIPENIDYKTGKPSVFVVENTENVKIIAVGLAKDIELKDHKSSLPSLFICVKGSFAFHIHDEKMIIKTHQSYRIPVNDIHKVVGIEKENLFLLIQEK